MYVGREGKCGSRIADAIKVALLAVVLGARLASGGSVRNPEQFSRFFLLFANSWVPGVTIGSVQVSLDFRVPTNEVDNSVFLEAAGEYLTLTQLRKPFPIVP